MRLSSNQLRKPRAKPFYHFAPKYSAVQTMQKHRCIAHYFIDGMHVRAVLDKHHRHTFHGRSTFTRRNEQRLARVRRSVHVRRACGQQDGETLLLSECAIGETGEENIYRLPISPSRETLAVQTFSL